MRGVAVLPVKGDGQSMHKHIRHESGKETTQASPAVYTVKYDWNMEATRTPASGMTKPSSAGHEEINAQAPSERVTALAAEHVTLNVMLWDVQRGRGGLTSSWQEA